MILASCNPMRLALVHSLMFQFVSFYLTVESHKNTQQLGPTKCVWSVWCLSQNIWFCQIAKLYYTACYYIWKCFVLLYKTGEITNTLNHKKTIKNVKLQTLLILSFMITYSKMFRGHKVQYPHVNFSSIFFAMKTSYLTQTPPTFM